MGEVILSLRFCERCKSFANNRTGINIGTPSRPAFVYNQRMAAKHPLKVFISYASADRERAQQLFVRLVSLGVDPWLDTENLLPGQEWKMAISRALDETDLVLLCLSKKSISKEGYVQKEMRLALDRALEMPPNAIFLVPCRFEKCDLPYSLREYQAVDIFTESGMNMLTKSLAMRAEKIAAAPLKVDGSSAPVTEEKKPAPRKKTTAKDLSNVEIHIHGNVTGSNIVVGNENKVDTTPDGDG